jgi:hypothetical protein
MAKAKYKLCIIYFFNPQQKYNNFTEDEIKTYSPLLARALQE